MREEEEAARMITVRDDARPTDKLRYFACPDAAGEMANETF
jgi:hypothetical protein